MLCYKGICKFKDDKNICEKDNKKCDLHHNEINSQIKECRFGMTSCKKNCYRFNSCVEV